MATIVDQWNWLPGRAEESLFVCYTWPGLPLGLTPLNSAGGPTRTFFPLNVLLPMWHVEFLFAAAALLQKASKLSKIAIVSNSAGKGTDGKYEADEEKEDYGFSFAWPNSISPSEQQQSSCCHINGQLL